MKNIFHHFKGLSVAKNSFRPESTPLKTLKTFFILKIFKFLSELFGHIEKRLN